VLSFVDMVRGRTLTMKYLLFINRDPAIVLSADERAAMPGAVSLWIDEMDGRGVRIEGHPLEPVSEAKTVRVRSGKALITDGPFAETRELIGGFDILDCADLSEALEVASKHPVAQFGSVELRAFSE
jgi:hypothetical protein